MLFSPVRCRRLPAEIPTMEMHSSDFASYRNKGSLFITDEEITKEGRYREK